MRFCAAIVTRPTTFRPPEWHAALPHRCEKGPFLVIKRAFHIQTINSLHDRFERLMEPFRGPATRNLTGYASWFIARSVPSGPERVEDAWDRLMAA